MKKISKGRNELESKRTMLLLPIRCKRREWAWQRGLLISILIQTRHQMRSSFTLSISHILSRVSKLFPKFKILTRWVKKYRHLPRIGTLREGVKFRSLDRLLIKNLIMDRGIWITNRRLKRIWGIQNQAILWTDSMLRRLYFQPLKRIKAERICRLPMNHHSVKKIYKKR